MKTPIRIYDPPCSYHTEIVDGDGEWVTQEAICDAVNNAAAGPWIDGPVPDGEEGDEMLFKFDDWIQHVAWAEDGWCDGDYMYFENPLMYAKISQPQPEEGGIE